MSTVINYQRFWQRRDTAANWASKNPVLASGEFGYVTDTGELKLGDGVTAWNSLGYMPGVLADPGADRLLFWDDSAGKYRFLTLGTGLSISDTTLDASGGSGQDASLTAYRCWDFVDSTFASSTATGSSFVTNNAVPTVYTNGAAGTGGTLLSSEAGHPGIVRLATGTTSTGYARIFFTAGPRIALGGGEQIFQFGIRIPTLSTSGERFIVRIGLANVIGGGGGQYCAFDYSDNINSGNWSQFAIDAGGTTTNNTSAAPVANTWTQARIVVNAAATSAELFAGGVSLGTVAANIPTGDLGITAWITKSVGTTSRTLDIDYCSWTDTFTSSR